jgi:hypothetical protein
MLPPGLISELPQSTIPTLCDGLIFFSLQGLSCAAKHFLFFELAQELTSKVVSELVAPAIASKVRLLLHTAGEVINLLKNYANVLSVDSFSNRRDFLLSLDLQMAQMRQQELPEWYILIVSRWNRKKYLVDVRIQTAVFVITLMACRIWQRK